MASIFELTSRLNPKILSERMYRGMYFENIFGKMIGKGFITAGGRGEEVGTPGPATPNFTGAPVDVFEQFVKQGKTDMDIPVRCRLTGDPVYGDQTLEGTGEGAVVVFRSVAINITRKAYTPPTGMSKQITKPYAESLITDADAQLRTWLNDMLPGNFILALCAGGSLDLLAPVVMGGRAQSYVSHPNLVVAGNGKVAYTGGRPGTAGYETAVEAALNGLTDTANCYFSVALVRNLAFEAARAKIAKIVMKNGYSFYPIFCSDAQFIQLQLDPEFKDFYKRLPEGLSGHPLATGARAEIAGCVIYPDMMLFGARTNATDANVTAGTVEYGPAPTAAQRAKGRKIGTTINNLDTSNLKIAILLGQSALSVGVGQKPQFTELVEDHGAKVEIGINMIQSIVRNDIYDHDGKVAGLTAGQFYENTSSLAIATYSKHALNYT